MIAAVAFVAAVASGLLAACDDITATDWSYVIPDTVLLYSLSNADYFGMPSVYGYTCRYYAKVEPVAIDTAAATLTFRYLANPNCNSRNLIPSEGS